jgi:hypothetical protein
MTAERERHLIFTAIPSLKCKGQIEGFRAQLKEQGEMTGTIAAALIERERQIS